jgi:hypothetical protein
MATRLRDPKGGLTAAGRRFYARTQGAKLKPGVKGRADTPEKMRRKGSWAARFYCQSPLPPLTKPNGKPTRLALTAAAWGEPVPRTVAAARRICAKGRALLKRYAAKKASK